MGGGGCIVGEGFQSELEGSVFSGIVIARGCGLCDPANSFAVAGFDDRSKAALAVCEGPVGCEVEIPTVGERRVGDVGSWGVIEQIPQEWPAIRGHSLSNLPRALNARSKRATTRGMVVVGMRAREVMTTPVETVHPDDEISEVLTRLARADFSGFPVIEDDRVVGIVSEQDLVDIFQPSDRTLWIPIGFPPFLESLTYGIDLSWDELDVGVDLVRNAGKPIRSVMTTPAVTVDAAEELDQIIELLAGDINRVPVLDDGRLVGIITRQDVLRALHERE